MKRFLVLSALLLLIIATQPTLAEDESPERLPAALAKALQEPDVDQRLEGLFELGSHLSLPEIPGALEAVGGLKELRERMVFQQATFARWGELAPEEAFAHIAALPESQSKLNTLRGVVVSFAQKNPQRAAAAAAAMKAGAARNDAIETIANAWADSDVVAALEWAQRLPDDFAKEAALNAIRYIWVHADPVAAAKHVAGLTASPTKTNLISNAVYEWAERDPAAALAWARSLPKGEEQNEALTKVAESWANQDPPAAAKFALGLPAGETRTAAAALMASRWARQDPRAAVEWCWRQEAPDIRTRGAAAVLEVWAPVDPAAAGQWLDGLPAGLERDQVIVAYVEQATMWRPDLAAGRALSIADEKVRARALDQCLSRWREVDRIAADRWMQSTDQPPALSEFANDEAAWGDLMVLAVQAQKAGDLAQAESLVADALKMSRRADPPDIRVAKSQMLLGEIYRWQRNFAAAEASLQEAVASCEKVVGPHDPQMIVPLDSLANFYYYTDAQYEKVLPLYQRLLRIVEQDPNLDGRDVAQRARNLGNVYRLLEKPAEAESYYKSAIAEVEQLGASSPDLPQHLLTLAEFYRFQERFAEAEPLAQRAVAVCLAAFGEDSLSTAISLDGLADVYLAWGKPAAAEPHYVKALEIAETVAGLEHSDLAPRLAGLAEAQRDQGKFEDAEANYQRAQQVVEAGLGGNAPELVPILHSYAKLLEKTNRPNLAKTHASRAAAIEKSSIETAESIAGGR